MIIRMNKKNDKFAYIAILYLFLRLMLCMCRMSSLFAYPLIMSVDILFIAFCIFNKRITANYVLLLALGVSWFFVFIISKTITNEFLLAYVNTFVLDIPLLMIEYLLYRYLVTRSIEEHRVYVSTYLIFCFISAVYTIFIAVQYPDAIRDTGTFSNLVNGITVPYGDYIFVFTCVIITIIIYGVLCLMNPRHKILLLVLFITLLTMILFSAYMTAFALCMLYIVIISLYSKKFKPLLILFAVLILIVFIFNSGTLNTLTQNRLNSIWQSITGNGEFTEYSGRSERLKLSFQAMFRHFFFGNAIFEAGDNIGGHAYWLDTLGIFGIFISLPFISFIIYFFKQTLVYCKSKAHKFITYLSYSAILAIGIFDNFSIVIGLSPLFFILPFISCLSKQEDPKNLTNIRKDMQL